MSATAPTQSIPPRPYEPGADASGGAGAAPAAPAGGNAPDAGGGAAAGPPAPTADRVPWYRRAWVLIAGAALLALLCFGGGFIAGSAASLFDGLLGGPDRTAFDGGPGFRDGVPPGDGRFPGSPGDTTSSQG